MTTSATLRRARSRRGFGDRLRAAILAAASDLVASAHTPSAVSIRTVADAVGVSAMAIYHHFADKQALLDAVVANVFADLDAVVGSAATTFEDPLEALVAQATAYVKFALERPGYYSCATMECHGSEPRVLGINRAHELFAAGVTACVNAGIFPSGDARMVSLEIWTAAHGSAAALIAQPSLPCGDDAMAFANRTLRSTALGHTASASGRR